MTESEIEAIRDRVDVLQVIGRDTHLKKVATTRGGEWAGPCPFCGGADRFRVQPEGGLWWCRQCSPDERWEDVYAYVMRRDGVNFQEAKARVSGGTLSTTFTPARSEPKTDRGQPADWRSKALEVVTICEAALWADTPGARGALDYLHKRGLTDETVKARRLGFNPASRTIAGLWVESGITIPNFAQGTLYGVNVRRPASFMRSHPEADKYKTVKGSTKVLYGTDHLTGKPDLVIVEGEFDAMLLHQEARAACDVLTMGAALSMPGGAWLVYLVNAQRFWISTDHDDTGDKAAVRWLELLGAKAQRVDLPGGVKDVTDFWKAGGNLWAWAASLAPGVVYIGDHIAEDAIGGDAKPAQSVVSVAAGGSDQSVSDTTPAEAAVLVLFDRWESADDPDDPKWRALYAEAAIAAGLPCYAEALGCDQGAAGWRAWAAQAVGGLTNGGG